MTLHDLPYISLSNTEQRDHDPNLLTVRSVLQAGEFIRIYFSKPDRCWFMYVTNRKKDVGMVCDAKKVLSVVKNKVHSKRSYSLLLCHPSSFLAKDRLHELLERDEQDFAQYLALLLS